MDVKQSLRTAVLAALLATGMARGATTASQQVQTVNFALTATVQGPSTATGTCTTASLATKDVIAALGRALNQTFSSKAQLVLLGDAANGFRFYVQDVVGKTNVDTLVNDNFSMNELGAVTKATISKGVVTTGSEYEVGLLAIQTPTLNLSLYGYGKQSLATGALTASGVGSGTVGANQNQAIFKGKVTFSAMKAQ